MLQDRRRMPWALGLAVSIVVAAGCRGTGGGDADGPPAASDAGRADVVAVSVSGKPGAYVFFVTVRSDDTGCTQYADWWEVLSKDGRLRHRRILQHSHVGEQPFARSSGPVVVTSDEELIVRAHMSNGGYTGRAMRGSVHEGFVETDLAPGFGAALAEQEPLPMECAY